MQDLVCLPVPTSLLGFLLRILPPLMALDPLCGLLNLLLHSLQKPPALPNDFYPLPQASPCRDVKITKIPEIHYVLIAIPQLFPGFLFPLISCPSHTHKPLDLSQDNPLPLLRAQHSLSHIFKGSLPFPPKFNLTTPYN